MSRTTKNLFWRVLELYFQDVIAIVKIRAVGFYVKAVSAVRCAFIGGVTFACALLLMLTGFILMHVAIFWFLPWSPEAKAIVLLILGFLYFLIPLLLVLRMCSQQQWMKCSKASELVDEAIGKK
jgi:hypothetical protein